MSLHSGVTRVLVTRAWERGNAADKFNGRNVNVSFTNNSNVANTSTIEVLVFVFYSDESSIDVKTGLVTRHQN